MKRSIWVGASLSRFLRKKMHTATARRATTAALIPMLTPILAASVIPPDCWSSSLAAAEVAAALLVVADVEAVATFVGLLDDVVGTLVVAAAVVAEEVVDVVDVVVVLDRVEDLCYSLINARSIERKTGHKLTVEVEVDSVDVVGSSVEDGVGSVVGGVEDVGIGAPGGRVAATCKV